MDFEKGKISSSQLMFLIAGFIQGSVLILYFMDSLVQRDAWLVVALSFFTSIPFVLSYVFLAKRFPGKSIIQINDSVFGVYFGALVSLVYIIFFLLLLSFQMRELWSFYTGFIMPETPKTAFLIPFALLCAFALYKGIENLARLNIFTVVFVCITVVFTFFLLLGNMDFTNFLPVGSLPLATYVHGMHIFTMYPLCEIVIFLMVFPALKSYKKAGKATLGGLAIAVITLLVIAIRNTAVLGDSATLFVSASYASVRLINIGEFLTRIELLVAIGITISLFIKTCVFFYGAATGVSQLLRLRSSSTMILPVGGIAVLLALIVFDSTVTHFDWGSNYAIFFHLPCEVLLPPLTLLIAKLRKLPRKEGVKTS